MTLYLITTEDIRNGTWWDDPMGFDSEAEARTVAKKLPAPPAGHCYELWRYERKETLAETPYDDKPVIAADVRGPLKE